MVNEVTVSPRYLKYNKADVERILGQVDTVDATPTADSNNVVKSGGVAAALAQVNTALGECATKNEVSTALEDYATTESVTEGLASKQDKMDTATEEAVRGIVQNWTPDAEPEEEDPDE